MGKLLFILIAAFLFLYCEKEQVSILDPRCEERKLSPSAPTLTSPPCGATLENGCSTHTSLKTWQFDWDDYPGAAKYQIFVMHEGARFSLVNKEVFNSEFTEEGFGYIANHNLRYWYWKVRAYVNGSWTEWSEKTFFHVSPLNC